MATTVDPATREHQHGRLRTGYARFARAVAEMMPTGLYARSLIIIIAPVVLLQEIGRAHV